MIGQDKKEVSLCIIGTRAELLLWNKIKNVSKIYQLDQLAFEIGHEVFRLHPCHAQDNVIEIIRAQVKET